MADQDLNQIEQSQTTKIAGNNEQNIADVLASQGRKSLSVDIANDLQVQVANKVEVEGSLISGAGLQTFTIESNQGMSQTFQDLVNVSGQVGFLYGFKFIFSNEQVRFRVEIDGIESFDLGVGFINDLNFEDFNNTGLVRWFGKGNFGELEFFPPTPVKYENSLKVQVRKIPTWNIELERAIIFYG